MTEVVVVADGATPGTAPAEAALPAPSGPQSPLASLRGKREALDASLFLDLAVPRWEGQLEGRRLWVRYRPASPAVFTEAMNKREQAHVKAVKDGSVGDPDWMEKANADLLIKACVAVYDLPVDEDPPKGPLPDGLPTFGSTELSDAVGAPHNAAATVLKVYATGADILLAATQLLNWSGQTSEETSTSFLGR